MRGVTKALLGSIILLASLYALSESGFCVGEIQHVFIPAETYPRTLKDMHLQTTIVEEATPKALIVVNTGDPLYVGFAQDINAGIRALPGLSQVSLAVIDDDAFLLHPRFDQSLILIGNYATNQAIRYYVYERKLQLVDAGSPGPDKWVMNNLRIGQEIGGKYQSANAIVIASESPAKLREAVDLLRNTMLPAARQGVSVVFDEGVPGRQSTRWPASPPATDSTQPQRTAAPGEAASHSVGGAVGHAGRYLLTGNEKEAEAFVNTLNGYGSIAENPRWFGVHDETQGFNSQVGDNSGALDFSMKDLVLAWMRVQRTPYFSDPKLPRHPGTTLDERLYIDKLLNWMAREYYKCSTARGLIDAGTGAPPVRGAIGYAERDGFPLGNHELRAALGLYLMGQYFTRDGYAYDASNIGRYYYDRNYPDDHAAQWMRDGDIAFHPYLQLSWVNDDGGGYYDSDNAFTRDYLSHKASPVLSQAYYGDSGGSLNVGMDRSVAETFCILTPNSLMKPGFGDTHGIGRPEYEVYHLCFWREKYLDGRYSWMIEDLYHLKPGRGRYGLINLKELGIQNQEPVDLLGIKVVPLQRNLFNVVSSFGGWASYDVITYGEVFKEAHVAPNEAANKVVFRSGWGHGFDQGRDQYLGIDCVSYLGHGHEDAMGIFGFEDNDAMFIVDNTYYLGERGYQNAVTVRKADEPAAQRLSKSNSSTVARVDNLADFTSTGFVDLELPQYGNFIKWGARPVVGEWSVDLHRNVFWKKEGLLLVLDQAKANNAGKYEFSLRWNPNYTPEYGYTLNGDTIGIVKTAESKHCVVRTLNGEYATDPVYRNARTIAAYSLGVGEMGNIPTLIYTYNGDNDPDYRISPAAGDGDAIYHITSAVTKEDIYLGKAENADQKSFGDFEVNAGLFYLEQGASGSPTYFALTKGLSLKQASPSQELFASDRPTSVECSIAPDALSGGIIVTGQGVTTIRSLYCPPGFQLIVAGRPETLPFTLTPGTHQFHYSGSGG